MQHHSAAKCSRVFVRLLLMYISKMSATVLYLVLQMLRSLYISDSRMSDVPKLLDWDA